jgi:ectoine hydroxylase-related dioxygenase (phytanoyl-CoA dioxygenase family)
MVVVKATAEVAVAETVTGVKVARAKAWRRRRRTPYATGWAVEEKVASKEKHSSHGRGINTSIPEQHEHGSASKSIGCASGKVGAPTSTAHLSSKLVRTHGHGARK